MNITEDIINEIRQLPEPLQREVLNFAQFLKQRAARPDLDNFMHAQHASMESIWNNEEDEAWDNVSTR